MSDKTKKYIKTVAITQVVVWIIAYSLVYVLPAVVGTAVVTYAACVSGNSLAQIFTLCLSTLVISIIVGTIVHFVQELRAEQKSS